MNKVDVYELAYCPIGLPILNEPWPGPSDETEHEYEEQAVVARGSLNIKKARIAPLIRSTPRFSASSVIFVRALRTVIEL